MTEYGSEILGLRRRHKIFQNDLANCVGIANPTLVDIEHNRIGIDDTTFARIKQAIDELATAKAVA